MYRCEVCGEVRFDTEMEGYSVPSRRAPLICSVTAAYQWFYVMPWVYPPPLSCTALILLQRDSHPGWPPHMYSVYNSITDDDFFYTVSPYKGTDMYSESGNVASPRFTFSI